MSIFGFLQKIWTDERGATAVEYGLILTLVVIAIIGSISAVADATSGMWTDVEQKSRDAIQQIDG
jgi:pilus assembly protein Flp/PilA